MKTKSYSRKNLEDFGAYLPGARKDACGIALAGGNRETKKRGPVRHRFSVLADRSGSQPIYFVFHDRDHLRRPLFSSDNYAVARDWRTCPGYDRLVEIWEEVYKAGFISDLDCRGVSNGMRVGPDYRAGGDVSPDDFMREVQPRGVQWGNWQNDRDAALNSAYDAVRDLAGFLGVETSWLFAGDVGLAFGARGRGRAAAHYEVSSRIINLTRRAGPGCLAHELAHAIDHRLAGVGGQRPRTNPHVQKVVRGIPKAMKERSAFADKHRRTKYFSLEDEMFARGFEAWVRHHVSNDFLANIVDVGSFKNPPAFPYPLGDEMPQINSIYGEFIEAIR